MRRGLPLIVALAVAWALLPSSVDADRKRARAPGRDREVVVYGGTPGGVLAAVTAARAGRHVILIEPTSHLGGMMSSGLGWTDTGDRKTIGGYARVFFDRVEDAAGTRDGGYHFAPSTAEAVFEGLVAHPRITVIRDDPLADSSGVAVVDRRIRWIRLQSGRIVSGAAFVDASYAGDLMAAAGVSYRVGREATTTFDESEAGVQPAVGIAKLPTGSDPGVPTAAPGAIGTGDSRIQASNYRICFSSDPANRAPFPRPAGYVAADFEPILHLIDTRLTRKPSAVATVAWFLTIAPVGGQKFDVNNVGSMSIAVPGLNYGYPEATSATRAAIDAAHRAYAQGFIWFLAHDPRVPDGIRHEMARYGLCKDEFRDNGNWPWLLYLREGRRMDGAYVLTQADTERSRSKPDVIGVASYRRDSHTVSRWVDHANALVGEGNLSPSVPVRWDIPYRSLTPRTSEIVNLIVPVAASASHVAHSSLRMEPQYMIMGEAAGEAAALVAGHAGATVQTVDVELLQGLLRGHGAFVPAPPD
jgi:hypothetical protein